MTMARAAARKPVTARVSVTPKPLSDEDIDWETIRAEYEIGKRPLPEIALEHGIHYNKIIGRARAEQWPKRGEVEEPQKVATELPEDAEALAARLTKLIAREIADLERQRKTERDEAEGERQARRLATLVRSIDKLGEIEQAARRAKKDDPAADRARRRAEDDAIRAALESRLARLAAVAETAPVPEEADGAGSAAAE
ncbi:hypothetical protein [Parvibaculum sp.]|uniref:hypothetical protein n=2 Tax=Parvibaculum sp. TaxID=2024848 RepID=UPI0025F1104E|nr:hypothetical protein [Parvibaculum sp.]